MLLYIMLALLRTCMYVGLRIRTDIRVMLLRLFRTKMATLRTNQNLLALLWREPRFSCLLHTMECVEQKRTRVAGPQEEDEGPSAKHQQLQSAETTTSMSLLEKMPYPCCRRLYREPTTSPSKTNIPPKLGDSPTATRGERVPQSTTAVTSSTTTTTTVIRGTVLPGDTKFPYGLSTFEEIRPEGQFFVNNSMFILQFFMIAEHLIFLCPVRFGKTLFLDMYGCFFDILHQGTSMFDGLNISLSLEQQQRLQQQLQHQLQQVQQQFQQQLIENQFEKQLPGQLRKLQEAQHSYFVLI